MNQCVFDATSFHLPRSIDWKMSCDVQPHFLKLFQFFEGLFAIYLTASTMSDILNQLAVH